MPTRSAVPVLAVAVVVVTVLAWASAFVGIRAVGADLSPGALALGRLLVGAAALGLLMVAARRPWVAPTRREWRLLAVGGIGWFGVCSVALDAAEQHLDAGTTAMLVNVGPLLIAVLAGLWLGEGLPRRLVAGLAVAFGGVLLIGLVNPGAEADVLGGVLCLVAAVTCAVGVVAQKPVPRRLPPLVLLMGRLLLGEVPPDLAVVGGAVCPAGVALSRRRSCVRPPVPVAREAGSAA